MPFFLLGLDHRIIFILVLAKQCCLRVDSLVWTTGDCVGVIGWGVLGKVEYTDLFLLPLSCVHKACIS